MNTQAFQKSVDDAQDMHAVTAAVAAYLGAVAPTLLEKAKADAERIAAPMERAIAVANATNNELLSASVSATALFAAVRLLKLCNEAA